MKPRLASRGGPREGGKPFYLLLGNAASDPGGSMVLGPGLSGPGGPP